MDWELWACAHTVLGRSPAESDSFVAQRIAALTDIGDAAGIATWRAIGRRIAQLRQPSARLN